MNETHNITVDDSALARIIALRESGTGEFGEKTLLRIAVEGGGCSGFQYRIEPADTVNEDDIVLNDAIVIDETSAPYMKNAVIRFQDDLMSAMFVIDNPNATSSCGCQASFSVDIDKL